MVALAMVTQQLANDRVVDK